MGKIEEASEFLNASVKKYEFHPGAKTILIFGVDSDHVTSFSKSISGYTDHPDAYTLDEKISEPFYPKWILHNSKNIVYYERPFPFENSGNPLVDLTSVYLTKKITDSSGGSKFVFLLNKKWMFRGFEKKVLSWMKSFSDYLQTVKKYKNSVILVIKSENKELPSEKNLTEFLERLKGYLDFFGKDFDRENILKLLEIFSGGRRGVFSETINENGGMKKLVESLDWSVGGNDLNYFLPEDSRKEIAKWTLESETKLKEKFVILRKETKKYLEVLTNTSENFLELKNKINNGYSVLSRLYEELSSSKNMSSTIRSVLREGMVSQVQFSLKPLKETLSENEYLDFMSLVPDGGYKRQLGWMKELEEVVFNLEVSESISRFLTDSYWALSSYQAQKMGENFFTELQQINKTNVDIFVSKLRKISPLPDDFPNAEYLSENHFKFLNNMWRSVKEKRMTLKSERLLIMGSFIMVSSISDSLFDYLKEGVSRIDIFASNTIFIDDDINADGKKLRIVMAAPTWNIIGNRTIHLRGFPGEKQEKAGTGRFPGDHGRDGNPGLPGSPGSIFFGIGMSFINGRYLKLDVSGGGGGDGQDGGDGAGGKNGHEPLLHIQGSPKERLRYYTHELIQSKSLSGLKAMLAPIRKTELYRVHGTKGGRGGDGGKGGVGGKGAPPGQIKLIELGLKSNINKTALAGKDGLPGKSGKGGVGGRNGQNLLVTYYEIDPDSQFNVGLGANFPLLGIFSMALGRREHAWTNGTLERTKLEIGKQGFDGDDKLKNEKGMIEPENGQNSDSLVLILNQYKKFLLDSFNPIARSLFLNNLESQQKVEDLYDIQGFLNEFQILKGSYSYTSEKIKERFRLMAVRLARYSPKLESENNKEARMIQDYIYTALLTEILRPNTNLLLNHIDSLKENILNLGKNAKSHEEVHKVVEYLKEAVFVKIKQINSLIQKASSLIFDLNKKAVELDFETKEETSSAVDILQEFITTCRMIEFLSMTGEGVIDLTEGKLVQNKEKYITLLKSMEAVNGGIAAEDSNVKTYKKKMSEMLQLLDAIHTNLDSPNKQTLVNFSGTWRIKTRLKNIKNLLKRFVRGLNVDSDVMESYYYLDELLTQLMDVFDGIQTYQAYKELSDHLTALQARSSLTGKFQNKDLEMMKCVIQTNIIQRLYESSLHCFSSTVFPLGPYFLKQYPLPLQVALCDSEGLAEKVIDNIEILESKVNESEKLDARHFERGDKIHSRIYLSNIKHGKLISRFLSGKEISVKSEINSSVSAKNVLKFKTAQLRFWPLDFSHFEQLKQTLSNYSIILNQLGNSYYKCGSEVFVVSGPPKILQSHKESSWFSFKSNDSISPYGLWSIQMVDPTGNNFENLKSFRNQIDVELEMENDYLKEESDVCYENLSDYYETDDDVFDDDSENLDKKRFRRSDYGFSTSSASKNVPFLSNFLGSFLHLVSEKISCITSKHSYEKNSNSNLKHDWAQFSNNNLLLGAVFAHLWKIYLRKPTKKPKEVVAVTEERKRIWRSFIKNGEEALKALKKSEMSPFLIDQFEDALEMRKAEVDEFSEETAHLEDVRDLEKNMHAFVTDLKDDLTSLKKINHSGILKNLESDMTLLLRPVKKYEMNYSSPTKVESSILRRSHIPTCYDLNSLSLIDCINSRHLDQMNANSINEV